VGKYKAMGKKEYLQSPGLIVTAFVERLGGGWRRGVATLNGKRIYEGKPTRSADEAMSWAIGRQKLIKLGLSYESSL
jgi:hypothetical protein